MHISTQGDRPGTDSMPTDEEPSIELKGSPTQRPNVSGVGLLKTLIPAAMMILAVFWINASHIYGVFLHQGRYVKGARVALADFDGGNFGEALWTAAASTNQSYGSPTYVHVDISQSSPEQIRQEVFDGKYWAAIVVQPGASTRFEAALNGTASSYNASQVYTYYLMTARYYTLYASGIQSTTITTVSTAAGIFSGRFAARLINSGAFANTTAAASALAAPAQPVGASAEPQGFVAMDDKAFINTLGAVFPILMQFFFIMAWNGVSAGMHFYAAYNIKTHMLARLVASTVWPFFTSLCSTGWTFAFRGSYKIDAKMFFAYWAVTWIYCMINFDMLDIITGFVPMAFVTFIFLTWVIFNVAAGIGSPLILHQWFRVNYFFPGLHWYQTCVTVLSKGGVNNLYYTLPVLAVWLVVVKCVSPLATRHRVKKAKEVFQYFNERNALDAPH